MVETPYNLISREYGKLFDKEGDQRVIEVGNISIGGDEPGFNL